VDLVLLDLSCGPASKSDDRLEDFLQLHRETPSTPIVVLCSAQHEGVALRAMRAGAADYVIKETGGDSLGRAIPAAIGLRANAEPSRRAGKVITLVGAKGGAGTTTVALNRRRGSGAAAPQSDARRDAPGIRHPLGAPPALETHPESLAPARARRHRASRHRGLPCGPVRRFQD